MDKFFDGIRSYFNEFKGIIWLFCSRSENRIVVIGDSHSQVIQSSAGVLIRHIGPVTLHRIKDQTEMIRSALTLAPRLRFIAFPRLSKNSIIVLSFGEIDIRVHVAKQAKKQGREPRQLVDELVNGAVKLVSFVHAEFGCKVVFMAIPPPSSDFNDPKYPNSGTLHSRVSLVNYFNEQLNQELASRAVLRAKLLNINELHSRSDGSMKPEHSDGTVHFNLGVGQLMASRIYEIQESVF